MIRVLQSFPRPGSQTNPYLTQLLASLPSDVDTLDWSWRAALFGRYDILHVHWPELLFRRNDPLRTFAHSALFLLLMLRIAASRIVIVRTAHNLSPHERGGLLERWLLRWCDRQTVLWIALNKSTDVAPGQRSVVIPHGHYRDWYGHLSTTGFVPGRLLFFGIVRGYKGVPDLIRAFRELSGAELSLHILGRPHPEDLRQAIEAACVEDPRVSAQLRFLQDEELARAIGESELVVLPYAQMHNSGALLLALSLDRPVLAPETSSTTALAHEVGSGWLLTFAGELNDSILRDALAQVRSAERSLHPDLSARDWPALGIAHRDAYLLAGRTH